MKRWQEICMKRFASVEEVDLFYNTHFSSGEVDLFYITQICMKRFAKIFNFILGYVVCPE